MKILANENVESVIVRGLRDAGHDVKYSAEIMPRAEDSEVLKMANAEDRIILTNDKDFGEFYFLQRSVKTGILLMRFEAQDSTYKNGVVQKVIAQYGDKLQGHFTVISENRLRLRGLS